MELVQGTLDVMILKALQWGPLHGYAISRWIKRTTEDVLTVEEGALYPALHRLRRKGLVESDWGVSENNRRAKFYQLTPKGRRALAEGTRSWETYARAVGRVLKADAPEEG
ncbi:MAG: PadR family transcriptional regulator [Gemmatimonadota bacterium]|nr:PadR family transcriptional regulator [Gemmatimonadota bacterium]